MEPANQKASGGGCCTGAKKKKGNAKGGIHTDGFVMGGASQAQTRPSKALNVNNFQYDSDNIIKT